MKIFAISDIHGCYDEMMALYQQLPIDLKEDRLVILGDMIDRGPKAKQVLQQLIDWQKEFGEDHVVVLYGNHEDLMLDALLYNGAHYNSFDLWWRQGGKETAHSYYPEGMTTYEKAISKPETFIDQEHLAWLASRPWYFEDDSYIFVHGGLIPEMTPEEIRNDPGLMRELLWIRDQFINSDWDWGKKVIFGHTADSGGYWDKEGKPFQPIIRENKIGIDTAVCPPTQNGLTCVELPSETFYFQPSFK